MQSRRGAAQITCLVVAAYQGGTREGGRWDGHVILNLPPSLKHATWPDERRLRRRRRRRRLRRLRLWRLRRLLASARGAVFVAPIHTHEIGDGQRVFLNLAARWIDHAQHQGEQQQRHHAGGDESQTETDQPRLHQRDPVLAASATSCTPAWRAWSITCTTRPVRASWSAWTTTAPSG